MLAFIALADLGLKTNAGPESARSNLQASKTGYNRRPISPMVEATTGLPIAMLPCRAEMEKSQRGRLALWLLRKLPTLQHHTATGTVHNPQGNCYGAGLRDTNVAQPYERIV